MGMFEAFEKCVWNTILQCSCAHTSSTGDIIVLPFHSKNYIREIPTLVSPILLSWSWSQFSSDVSPWPTNCSWVYTRWWWWVKWYNHYITNLVMLPWCTEYLISQCKIRTISREPRGFEKIKWVNNDSRVAFVTVKSICQQYLNIYK